MFRNLRLAPLLVSAMALFACEVTTTTVVVPLCDPVTVAVGADPAVPDAPPSTDGGRLRITGRHFWLYSSNADVADPITPTPSPTPTADEPTLTPEPTPVPATYVLQHPLFLVDVYVGGHEAKVVAAYEQVVTPFIEQRDLDGNLHYADCASCTNCLNNIDNACGECETACMGCEQVIELEIPALAQTDGVLETDGLLTSVNVFAEGGQVPAQFTLLPLACSDLVDNDQDGQTDADDPACLSTGWTEISP